MGCASSKPERPKVRLLHDLSRPYEYPQTQHAPGRNQPMQYAAQSANRQPKPPRLPVNARHKTDLYAPSRAQPKQPATQTSNRHQNLPRLPVNARCRADSRTQAASSHRATQPNPRPSQPSRTQAPRNNQTTHRPQRTHSKPRPIVSPTPSTWPLSNPIPNRFETPFPAPRPTYRNAHNAHNVEITMPARSHQSQHASIAVALSPDIETKARLSRYWDGDPITGYKDPSPTESLRAYGKLQRLSRPFGDYVREWPEVVPRSRSVSPEEWKGRAKGKGKGKAPVLRLRLDMHEDGQDWFNGAVSPEFTRIEAMEMGVLDREGERVREREWEAGMRI